MEEKTEFIIKIKSTNMEKLRNRNIFEEIKKKVVPIQDTTQKSEQERDQEFEQLRKNIFGD